MPQILVYSKPYCPYCDRAKDLLTRKGVVFEVVDLMDHPERRDEMIERSGGRMTVPQIFIGGTHVGGYDDLSALDRQGGLDPLLQD